MATSRTESMTHAYTLFEAWVYDQFVAPKVLDSIESDDTASFEGMIQELPRGIRLLDVGCGGGHLALRMEQRRPDLCIVGVDLMEHMIGQARRRGRRRSSAVEFRQGDALNLPFDDESFDLVLSIASLKHWSDRAAGLRECFRVLVPGGQLAVIELDRGCTLDTCRRFTERMTRGAAVVHQLLLMLFYTFIVGQSLDLDEARALVEGLGASSASVERIEGSPMLMIRATRPAAAPE